MPDLFTSPVLVIEQLSSQLEYRISDGNGQQVGMVTQFAGPRPRTGLAGSFSSGLGGRRVIVQVAGPGTGLLFYVDYQPGAPPAIVGADGAVIGRYMHDRLAQAQQATRTGGFGAFAQVATGRPPADRTRLVDDADRTLCQVAWSMRRSGSVESNNLRWIPVAGHYTDAADRQIAYVDIREAVFKDRYVLQLPYQLPEPMRTMVIASPLAFDLIRS